MDKIRRLWKVENVTLENLLIGKEQLPANKKNHYFVSSYISQNHIQLIYPEFSLLKFIVVCWSFDSSSTVRNFIRRVVDEMIMGRILALMSILKFTTSPLQVPGSAKHFRQLKSNMKADSCYRLSG